MTLENFVKCVTVYSGQSLKEWFISRDHIPFDAPNDWYEECYEEFLHRLWTLYRETGDNYYWMSGGVLRSKGRRIAINVVPANSIKIDKSKVRQLLIDDILEHANRPES